MAKFLQQFNIAFLLILTIVFVACNKSDSAKVSRQKSDIKSAQGLTADMTSDPSELCEMPFSLSMEDKLPVRDKAQITQGQYELVSVEMYMMSEIEMSAFYVSSDISNDFKPSLECKTQSLFDTSTRLMGEFKISDILDTESSVSDSLRSIKAEVKDGQFYSKTEILQTSNSLFSLNELSLDRIEVGEDRFMTIWIYQISDDQLEVRSKLELPADADGKRLIQFTKSLFRKL